MVLLAALFFVVVDVFPTGGCTYSHNRNSLLPETRNFVLEEADHCTRLEAVLDCEDMVD